MMRPAQDDPIWTSLSPETRTALMRQISAEAAAAERAVTRHRHNRPEPGWEIELASDEAALRTAFAGLRRAASIDTAIAYAPAAMALATAIWAFTTQVGGTYALALTLLFLVFASFGVVSVRLQGKHRPGLNNPDDIDRVVRLAQRRILVTADGLAELGSTRGTPGLIWHPLGRDDRIRFTDRGLSVIRPDQTLDLALPQMRAYRAGAPLSADATQRLLTRHLGERYHEAHARSVRGGLLRRLLALPRWINGLGPAQPTGHETTP